MQKISERIYSVGVNDGDKELFEGLWPLPFGVSYNSYIVADEKIALIDTVESGFEDEFLANIQEAIGDRAIDYLVVNHMEPDHSSLTSYMLDRYPDLKIIANAKALPMLKGYYEVPNDRVLLVKEAESVSLGGCSLSFFMIPMVHWPETMVTWLAEENTVFSGDAFGTFGSVDDDILDCEGRFEQYKEEMIRYYSNIVGKYGTPVQSALKKLSGLPVERICSTHGPVWTENVPSVIALYDSLSRYEVERGVCIVYGSMYGNTAAAADALAVELESRGIPYAVHDLAGVALESRGTPYAAHCQAGVALESRGTPYAAHCQAGNNAGAFGLSGALRDVFKYDTIVVGSPTYNNGIFPPVESFMKALQSRLVKSRRFYAFGSYTWSASSVSLLNKQAESMGYEVLGEGCAFPQAYSATKFDVVSIADLLLTV